jgi:arylsulfatase
MMGKSEKSARESVMIYIGNEFFGVKWRNWKMLLKDLDQKTYTIQTKAYPLFYDLVTDPKEEHPISAYIADTWVDYPLYQVLEDFEESLEKDPGTPGPRW